MEEPMDDISPLTAPEKPDRRAPPAPADAWPATVRQLLLETWGAQACQRPADWPEALARLLKDGAATPGGCGYGRGSLAPVINAAVGALARRFDDVPPTDPADAVWRVFPKLDQAHCTRLATLLIEARSIGRAAA
jgi:hypothetical protein